MFDYVSLQGFEKGIDRTPYIERKERLRQMIEQSNFKYIKEVKPLYVGEDKNKIIEFLDIAKSNNEEGIMLNIPTYPYECKRSGGILKVKVMSTMDLKVIGFKEGTKDLKGTLGALVVEYKDNTVGVGSGLQLPDRHEIWANKDKYIGKIVEVQYFEISKNSKTGLESLRLPIFKGWRFDKSEVSYE